VSGAHARPPEPIRLSVWQPIAWLALAGVGAPAAVVMSAGDAHSAPASVSVPDIALDRPQSS
jgi:hypothetical protein